MLIQLQNLLKLAVEKRPVRQTKGEDCVLFLGITDNSMESEQFVTVNLFRPSARDLPNIESEGDIVILRNLRVLSCYPDISGLNFRYVDPKT